MYNGIGADEIPTAPYRVPGAAPGGPGGFGSGSGAGKSGGKGGGLRGKRAAAIAAVCAAIAGGAFAVAQATTSSPAPQQAADTQALSTQAGAQAGTSASAAGQASLLREVLTTTGPRRLARLRLLGGMYGQFTFETKSGPRTLAFERGTITSVNRDDVQVRAADGTTLTWELTGTSVVRENGAKEPQATLAQGQTVFAGGPVTGGSRDARLIVIRKAGTPEQTPGAA